MSKFIVAARVLIAALVVVADLVVADVEPKNKFGAEEIELPSHRLPTRVRPIHYKLHFDFTEGYSFASDALGSPRTTYTGSVNITVEFLGPDNPRIMRCFNRLTNHIFSKEGTSSSAFESRCAREGKKNQIILHADQTLYLKSIKVYKKHQGQLKELKIAKSGRDRSKQLLALDMVCELPPAGQQGLIQIEFEGPIRRDLHGLYVSTSRNKGVRHAQLVAKFQPTFARLALPCFDEPAFKATFALSMTHWDDQQPYATTELESQANTSEDGYVRMSAFKTTPPMPIHMLGFTLGQYDEPLEMQMRDNLRLRVITPPGKRQAGAYALEVAQFAIETFENYIGFEYPLDKLDLVAITDTDFDNTETWGLVFVRDILALVDDETKADTRITTAVNVAHVVVHQWFANLITPEWWDDLWITEGIAAQMAFELTSQLFPESKYFVRIATLSGILDADSSGKSHALSPPSDELKTSDQVYDILGKIGYMRSGALMRMLENTLGYEAFRRVLQNLVRERAYGNVNMVDLLEFITESPESKELPIQSMLNSWTTLTSYPVINVNMNAYEGVLLLYEEPRPKAMFEAYMSNERRSTWTLPVKVLFSTKKGDKHEIKVATLGMDSYYPHVAKIQLPSWFNGYHDFVKVSPDPDFSTYYLVRYSHDLTFRLEEPLKQGVLNTIDRLHFLGDSRALAASRLILSDVFKRSVEWYAHETDPAIIIEALLASQTMSSLSFLDKKPSNVSQVFVRLFERSGFQVTGDESLLEQRARMVVLRALVAQGVQEVIDAGVQAYVKSKGDVALFLREPVYAAVVANGNEEQLNQLLKHLERTESYEEQVRLASALALTRNNEILNHTAFWLSSSDLPKALRDPIWKLIKSTKDAMFGKRSG